MVDFQLLTVRDAHKPLGFRSEKHLYRVIRENQFPFPQAIVRFGKQIRINLEAVAAATKQISASTDGEKK